MFHIFDIYTLVEPVIWYPQRVHNSHNGAQSCNVAPDPGARLQPGLKILRFNFFSNDSYSRLGRHIYRIYGRHATMVKM